MVGLHCVDAFDLQSTSTSVESSVRRVQQQQRRLLLYTASAPGGRKVSVSALLEELRLEATMGLQYEYEYDGHRVNISANTQRNRGSSINHQADPNGRITVPVESSCVRTYVRRTLYFVLCGVRDGGGVVARTSFLFLVFYDEDEDEGTGVWVWV
ncbi:hypothetical protein E4T56_gene16697 [Termitomyces sp. T112]|nr:hypothetical protein E4T56_gene16697 [Termitomyces sp. T112]